MHRQPKGRFAIALLFSLGTASITVAQETISNRVFPSNTQPILYAPPERVAAGTPAPEHYVNVFLPPGTPPTAGWPSFLRLAKSCSRTGSRMAVTSALESAIWRCNAVS